MKVGDPLRSGSFFPEVLGPFILISHALYPTTPTPLPKGALALLSGKGLDPVFFPDPCVHVCWPQ